jgi:hypothetical protein
MVFPFPHLTIIRKEDDGECIAAAAVAAERTDLFSFLLFTHKKKNRFSRTRRAAYRLPAAKFLFLLFILI